MRGNNAYADRYCADGVFSDGWRKVRKGGRVKCGGDWYSAEELKSRAGDLVHVQVGEYWGSYILVSAGAIGCMSFICKAYRK